MAMSSATVLNGEPSSASTVVVGGLTLTLRNSATPTVVVDGTTIFAGGGPVTLGSGVIVTLENDKLVVGKATLTFDESAAAPTIATDVVGKDKAQSTGNAGEKLSSELQAGSVVESSPTDSAKTPTVTTKNDGSTEADAKASDNSGARRRGANLITNLVGLYISTVVIMLWI